jgi:hypothetical protein
VGETVPVKYDPVDHTIVLVDPFRKLVDADLERARQERAQQEILRAKQIEQKEKEARLLRDD